MSEDDTHAVRTPLAVHGQRTGDRIGDWRLGEPLGEGGSSVVFAATRQGDFAQEVALKLLRTGVGDDRFVSRFERERRILAELEHPNIVRILDGGTTPTGAPWYAMDRIEGEDFAAWCTRQPRDQRLRALVTIARAVEFAHRSLVVHCDLKPENILVDAGDAPRVLDFGIARLLDEGGYTGTAQLLTPRWAAPEQVQGGRLTTATDVYTLGLILWSILTGETPRDGATGAALLQRALEPVGLPSATDPQCRGDLDAIVTRACALDPSERYPTAGALADDIERHLNGEPVQARDGLFWYRASRWMLRHRSAVAVGLAGLSLLLGWAGTSAWQARAVAHERDEAQRQAERAEASLGLLLGILEAADPNAARGQELTVSEVLQTGQRELDVTDADRALTGEVRFAIGRVQIAVGEMEAAETTLTAALDEVSAVYGPDHPERIRIALALAYAEAHTNDFDTATLERADGLLERFRTVHGDSLEVAQALLMAADLRLSAQDLERGRTLATAAHTLFEARGDERRAARALAVLGGLDCRESRDPTRLTRAVEQTRQALGTEMHPEYADALHELAYCSEPANERKFSARAFEIREALYGESWPLATALNNYGMALETVDPERANALLARAARLGIEHRGEWSIPATHIRINQGAVLVDTGHPEEGIAILAPISTHADLPPDERAYAWRYRGHGLKRLGDTAGARAAYQEGLALVADLSGSVQRDRLEEALAALSPLTP